MTYYKIYWWCDISKYWESDHDCVVSTSEIAHNKMKSLRDDGLDVRIEKREIIYEYNHKPVYEYNEEEIV